MSSYLKKGKRLQARKDKKEVKHRTKEVYKILGELDEIAEEIKNDPVLMERIDADNLLEFAQPLTERKLGNLEKFILKGKLGMYGDMEEQAKSLRADKYVEDESSKES